MDVCFAVIKKDSLNSSRPISNQAETPTQIEEMFDAVSYNKVVNAVELIGCRLLPLVILLLYLMFIFQTLLVFHKI